MVGVGGRPAPARDPRAQVQCPQCSAAPKRGTEATQGVPRKLSPARKGFFKAEVNKEMSSCATDLEGKKKFNNFPGVAVKYFHFRNWLFFFFFKELGENESSSV